MFLKLIHHVLMLDVKVKTLLNLLIPLVFLISCGGPENSKRKKSENHPSDLPPKKQPVKKVIRKIEKTPVKVVKKVSNILTFEEVQAGVKKFENVVVDYPKDELAEDLKPVIKKLIEAGNIIDKIFLKQVNRDNEKIKLEIEAFVKKDPSKSDYLKFYKIMYGPWDRLQGDKPFWGKNKKPAGAGFYDKTLTKKAFNIHLNSLEKSLESEKDKKQKVIIAQKIKDIKSLFTIVDRKDGKFITTPYREFYKTELLQVSKIVKEAADLSKEPTLKKYLTLLSKSLLTDNYRKSDFAWIKLKGDIEVILGPYEVYEDHLNGYKAAFQIFLNLRDKKYGKKLDIIKSHVAAMDKNLPLDPKYKYKRGNEKPIVVVNELFTAGDTKAAIQTLAFNLPNDEEVRKKGYKLVLLKNIADLKYAKILVPISKRIINPSQHKLITFDAFFTHTLVHEVTHGLGPGTIKIKNEKTKKTDEIEVRKLLKEYYVANEEAKADVGGLLGLEYLVKKAKIFPDNSLNEGYVTFIASIFRSIRFGIKEAHGRANLMALNYLMKEKAVIYDLSTVTFTINLKLMPKGCRKFIAEILKIQATGDYDKARSFQKKWGSMNATVKKAIQKLDGIPVDIYPKYQILEDLGIK
jgi:hypothetical protein